MGGKWTIYRKMGEETIEQVITYLKGLKTLIKIHSKKINTYENILSHFKKNILFFYLFLFMINII